jgi:hypothetical protein
MDVLDGQQRLLTLRLWCTALIDEHERQNPGSTLKVLLSGREEPVEFDRSKVVNIKVHALDEDEWHKIQNKDVLKQKHFDPGNASSVIKAYLYFRFVLLSGINAVVDEQVIEIPENKDGKLPIIEFWKTNCQISPISKDDIVELLAATAEKLDLSVLEHQSSDEPVEVIFETLNSQREELGQFDLFRNFLLISSNSKGKNQKSLYSKHLASSERQIQEAKLNLKVKPLDRFLYDFVIGQAMTHGTVKSDSTVKVFRDYWKQQEASGLTVSEYLDGCLTPSMNSWLAAISGGNIVKNLPLSLDPRIQRCLSRIEEISRGPFTPLTARIIFDWSKKEAVGADELLEELKLVETFVVRRLLAGEAFSPLRREVMGACSAIYGTKTITLKEWVTKHSASDDRVRKTLAQTVEKDGVDPSPGDLADEFYQRATSRATRAIFDAIVEHQEGDLGSKLVKDPGTKETKKESIWVEHLFPQSNSQWLSDFSKWDVDPQRMSLRLHAIGNLAVIPAQLDRSIGNKPLAEKQKALRNAKIPAWKTLYQFMESAMWTPHEIDRRTLELTETCLTIWALPS